MKSPKAIAEIRRILLLQIGAKAPKHPQKVAVAE
jgi:hypothetical protein